MSKSTYQPVLVNETESNAGETESGAVGTSRMRTKILAGTGGIWEYGRVELLLIIGRIDTEKFMIKGRCRGD
jgi:hypothetical protein